jgi:hypothetical protein
VRGVQSELRRSSFVYLSKRTSLTLVVNLLIEALTTFESLPLITSRLLWPSEYSQCMSPPDYQQV